MLQSKQPHDHFFKVLFSNKEVVSDYIRQLMPKEVAQNLDLDTLEKDNDSFIDDDLKEHLSDIVYQCNWKQKEDVKVCLLFEHKSYVEKYPHFQLLRYILNSWEHDLKQERSPQIVIPIILYHGKQKWHYQSLPDYFSLKDKDLVPFIPKFEYHLTDLSKYSDEEILALEQGFLINGLILLKHKLDKDYILQYSERVFIYTEYYQDRQGRNFIRSMFVYIWYAFTMKPEELNELINKLPENTKDMALSTYDMILKQGEEKGLEKGMEKGMEKGLEKGIETKAIDVIEKLLRKFPDWTDKQIAELIEVEESLVAEIRSKLKK